MVTSVTKWADLIVVIRCSRYGGDLCGLPLNWGIE